MTLTPPAPPRSRVRRIARGLGTVLLAAGVALLTALVATDVWHLGSDRTSASGEASAPATAEPGTGPVEARRQLQALAEEHPNRPLTHEAPLRLLVAGDSISGGVGQALGDLTSDTGIVEMHLDYRVGSGLYSGDRNWFERAAEDIREVQPEAVVFFAGTNDAVQERRFTDDEYEQRVGDLMDLLSTYDGTGEVTGPSPGDDGSDDSNDDASDDADDADGGVTDETTTTTGPDPGSIVTTGDGTPVERTVLWVGAPTLRNWNDGAQRVNRLAARAASERDHVVYVDAFELTSVDGDYDDTVTVLYGSPTRIRSGDGVHFTNAGNEYLASVIFELLDQRWALRDQAEPGRPIAFRTADGGGSAPGIRSGSSESSESSGSGTRNTWTSSSSADPPEDEPTTTATTAPPITTPTTTATTAPPTTAPPTTAPPTTAPPTTAPPTTAPPTTATTAPPTPTG